MFNKISQIKAWTTCSKFNKSDPKYLFRNYFKKKSEKISPLSSPEEFSKTNNGHADESYADGFSTTKNKSHKSEISFESKIHSLSQNLQAESPTGPDQQSSTSHEAQSNRPSPPPECSTSLVNTANTHNGLSLDSPGLYISSEETCEQVNNDSNSLNHEFQGMKSNEIFSMELPSPSSNVSMTTKKAASNSQVELLSSQRNISKKENRKTSSQTSKLSSQPAKVTLKSKKQFFSDQNKMINNPNSIKYNLMSTEGNDKSSSRARKDNSLLGQSPQSFSPRRKVCSTNKASKLGATRTSSHSVDKMMDTKQAKLPRVSASKSPKRSCTVDSSKSRKNSSPSEKSSTRSHPLITGSRQVNSVTPLVNKSPSRKSSLQGGKDKLVSPQLKVRNSILESLSNSEKISIYSKEKIITTKESTVLKSQRKCSKVDLSKSSKKLSKKSKQPIDGILQPKAVTTAFDKTPTSGETNLLYLENLKRSAVTKKPPKSKKISQNSEKLPLQRTSLSGHGRTPKTQRVKAPRPKKSAPMNKVKNENVFSSPENPCARYEKLSAPDLLSSPPSKLLIPLSSHSFSTTSLSPRNSSFVSITPSASSSSNVKTVILKEQSPSATSSTSQGNSSFVNMLPIISSSSNVNNAVLEKHSPSTKTQDLPCLVSSMHSEKNPSQLSKDSNSSSMTSLSSKDASLLSDNAMSSTNETLITLSGNILANLENILETSEGMLLPTQNIEKEKRHHKSISNHLQISSSYNQKDVSPCEVDCDIVTEFSSSAKDNSFLLGNSLNSEYKAYTSGNSSGSKTEQSPMCCGITSPAARLSLTSCCKSVSSGKKKESSESSTISFYCRGESTMTQMLKLFCSFLILLMLSTTTLVMIVNRLYSK